MTSRQSGPERPDRRGLVVGAAALALASCTGGETSMRDDTDRGEAGTEGSVTVGGVAIRYRRAGRGSTVVLLHGASGNHRDWTLGAFEAISRDHDTIAFDRPGLGQSGWPGSEGTRLDVQARLLLGALDRLGVSRVILVGHSYGGSVALAWALVEPASVTGLMLLAAPSQVWPGGLGLSTDLLASPVTGPLIASAIPAVLPGAVAEAAAARVFAPQAPPPGYVAHLGFDRVLRAQALRANALQLAALKDQIRTMVPHYPALAIPVEVLHGTSDSTVPLAIHSEPFAAQVAQARLTRLEGIGHMPHHAALPDVLQALARLSRV
jgi:pimeloyl-ACP methyl ester carboxylesterase